MLAEASGVFLGQRLVLYRPDPDKSDGKFLLHAMRSAGVQAQIKAFGSGSTVEHMRVPDCGEIMVSCPCVADQRRIGAVLSAFDDLIEINERRIELSEDLARSLYREWFVRFRFPGHQDTGLEESELGLIPAGWNVRRLGDVCSFVRAGGTPKRSEPTYWEGGTVPWFKTGELRDGPLTHSIEMVTANAGVRLFESPAILMAIYGSPTVGRLGWLTRTSSCNQAALSLRTQNPDFEQDWLWYQLKALREHFNAISQGAAQQNISKDKVIKTPVVFPPSKILRAFAEGVRPIRELWHKLAVTNEKLVATRDLLLPRLVTGRLAISDINLGDLLSEEVA